MTTRTAAWLWLCTISLAVPALAAEEPNEGALVKVVLTGGQELRGYLLEESPESVSVQLLSGGRLEVPRGSIRSLTRDEGTTVRGGTAWFQDPNRTRYFYAPSGMMLRAGEGYFSQKELVFSAVAYGVTDHITVLAGCALPLLAGWNLIGGVKVGVQVAEQLHLAAGAESLVLPAVTSGLYGAGLVFGSGTIGDRDRHLTLSVGKPFLFPNTYNMFGEVVIVAAGNVRLTRNLALVTENWFFPTAPTSMSSREPLALYSAGIRVMADRMAADIGLIRLPGFSVPVPWLDFTYNFGP